MEPVLKKRKRKKKTKEEVMREFQGLSGQVERFVAPKDHLSLLNKILRRIGRSEDEVLCTDISGILQNHIKSHSSAARVNQEAFRAAGEWTSSDTVSFSKDGKSGEVSVYASSNAGDFELFLKGIKLKGDPSFHDKTIEYEFTTEVNERFGCCGGTLKIEILDFEDRYEMRGSVQVDMEEDYYEDLFTNFEATKTKDNY